MCIVSFYRKDDQFVLTHNRDEEINRISSNEIMEQTRFGKTYFSPVDQRAKGTWIFHSDEYIGCILNGGEQKPLAFKPQYKESRGIILLNLLHYPSVKEFIKLEDLSNIAPFTLFVFEKRNKNAYLLFWNENELKIVDVTAQEIVTWCSSTLYSPNRRIEIDEIFQQNHDLTVKEIFQLHQQLKMEKGEVSEGIATTSISQIRMDNSKTDMKYCQLF